MAKRPKPPVVDQSDKDHGAIVTIVVTTIIGTFVAGLFLWGVAGILDPMLGSLPAEMRFALYGGAVAFALAFGFVVIILQGAKPASEHRALYLALRNSLADNGIGTFYAWDVRRMLAGVDRFFGDAPDQPDGLFPTAFGWLDEPAPLWTARAYDRCLMLALVYPLLVVLLGWVVSGEALAVEQALLMRDAGPEERMLAVGLMLVGLWLVFMASHKNELMAPLLLIPAGIAVAGSSVFFGAGAVVLVVLGLFSNRGPSYGLALGAVSIAIALAAVASVAGVSFGIYGISFAVIVGIIVVVGVVYLLSLAQRQLGQGLAVALFSAVFLAISVAGPAISPIGASDKALTLLFFVGLLTLVNAPFDWFALGISRALLRRGLQQGGFAPLWLGLLDVAVSLVLMTALAIAVLWSAEVFDAMTLWGGNPAILDPEAMLAELRNNAKVGNTHYWWLYAMLFSTQIPALLNLLFGVFCVLRGVTGWNAWMLLRLPETGEIGVWQRMFVGGAWAGQFGLAVAIGLLGVYAFFTVLIQWIDPGFGSHLIDVLDGMRILPIRPPGTLVG